MDGPSSDREQARQEKAAASCLTPKLPHCKAALNVPEIHRELVLHLHAIDLHLHHALVERAWGAALEPTRRAPGIKRSLLHDPGMGLAPPIRAGPEQSEGAAGAGLKSAAEEFASQVYSLHIY